MKVLDKYRTNLFSQNGEDGVLSEIFTRVGIEKGTFCEFGAADGKFCSNTWYLLQNGWTGKYLEADSNKFRDLIDNTIGMPVELYCGHVKSSNANELIPAKLNLLSIDIDNDDYHVWSAYSGKPDVVVIEVNSSKPPGVEMTPGIAGSSYTSMVRLGISKGYFLAIHMGNCIFIRNDHRDKFPECIGDGLTNPGIYFDKSWL